MAFGINVFIILFELYFRARPPVGWRWGDWIAFIWAVLNIVGILMQFGVATRSTWVLLIALILGFGIEAYRRSRSYRRF